MGEELLLGKAEWTLRSVNGKWVVSYLGFLVLMWGKEARFSYLLSE